MRYMSASASLPRRFTGSRDGTVAVAFAGGILAVLLAAGAALDYGHATRYQTMLDGATDAASLAAAKLAANGVTDRATLETMTRQAFDANTAQFPDTIVVDGFTVVPMPESNEIRVTASLSVPTTLMALANMPTIPIRSAATARTGQIIEVALMLDLTGSMASATSDRRALKIDVLEQAAKDLVETLMPDRPGLGDRVRIGLAPYASGVDVGADLGPTVTGHPRRRCVVDRSGTEASTDAPPALAHYPTGNGCPTRTIMPLTSDRAALLAALTDLPASGATAGALGTAFAYNLLSPRWGDILPAASVPQPYRAPDLKKIAILMTDGEYNVLEGKAANAAIVNARAEALCSAMKADGITVYTVGFELRGASSRGVLRDCASTINGKKAFFDARDGADLIDAYRAIADEIMRLHLSA